MEQFKTCTKCGQIKNFDEYHKHKRANDGLSQRCKECRKVDTKNYNDANRDTVRAKSRANHHKNKAVRNAKRSELYCKDPELSRQKSREQYAKNPEKSRSYAKKWRKENPEQRRVQEHTRRARENAVYSEPYTDADVLALYGSDCHLCGLSIDLEAPRMNHYEGWQLGLHIDHVIPISWGGEDTLRNVKPSHGLCNLQKPKKAK
jgi:hypothetical protein